MWIVKNLLRGTLTLRGMDVSIPPKGEFDLDTIGREKAESSNQVLVAFEEGYLQNVFKDQSAPAGGLDAGQLDDKLASFREQIMAELKAAMPQLPEAKEPEDLKGALAGLRKDLAGDMEHMLKGLRVAKLKLQGERERLLVDQNLSKEDVKARLAVLEDYERNLEKNFERLGSQVQGADDGTIADRADLLSNI